MHGEVKHVGSTVQDEEDQWLQGKQGRQTADAVLFRCLQWT